MPNIPKYQLIYQDLMKKIHRNEYDANDKFPTEKELSLKYQVSRQTVRQALRVLEQQGIINRRQGSGSFLLRTSPIKETSNSIAVVTTYVDKYIFPTILSGIEGELAKKRYHAIISATKNRRDNERIILKQMLEKPIDGILIEGAQTALPNSNLDIYNQLNKAKIPLVFINGVYRELNDPIAVVADDYGGGYQATEFLIKKGHKKIAGIFKSDDIQGHHRFKGFANALFENNLQLSDDNIVWFATDNINIVISNSVDKLINSCSAIVCYNDMVAAQVIPIIIKNGKKVPDDVAIISFDNSIYSELSPVKITSCENHKHDFGIIAAQKIIGLLDNISQETSVLPWEIIEKDST